MKFLKFLFILIATICLIVLSFCCISSSTFLDKNYIINKLNETDFYSKTYDLANSNFEKYIYQSGLEESALSNIITKNKIEKDINIILSNFYDGKNETIDTSEIFEKLNSNIEKLGVKNSQNEDSINEFVNKICEEYKNTLNYNSFNKLSNINFSKIVRILNTIKIISIILGVVSLIAILLINKRSFQKDLQAIGIIMLSASLFEIIALKIIKAKVSINEIKIFDDVFSSSLVTIINDILNKFNLFSIIILIIAIILILLYSIICADKNLINSKK